MTQRTARTPAPRARWSLLPWLLPLAVSCAGVGLWLLLRPPASPAPPQPDAPATAEAHFVDVTARAGIRFRHVSGATARKLLPETMGSGVAVLDFDRDGFSDLFFVNSRSWPGEPNPVGGRATQALYRNRGDGTFEDVTQAVGLDVELYGMGVAVGDYDNDGFADVFVSCVGGNRLFRNAKGQKFEDVTARAGLGTGWTWPNEPTADFVKRAEPIEFPSSAVWLDYDGDGGLDLFVCYYLTWAPAHDLGVMAVLPGGQRAYVPPQQFGGAQCRLYRNLGGTFEDVSTAAGVHVSEPGEHGPRAVGKALGVIACDADGDGWPDLVVANDTVRNFFFHNRPGSNGTRVFQEGGLFAGIAYADGRPRGGMGIDAGEIAPGSRAIVIANFTNEPNSLFRLTGTNPVRFVDVAAETGMSGPSRAAMKFGTMFLDFDRDGFSDLFTANGHLEPDIATAQPGQTHAQSAQLLRNTGRPGEQFVVARGPGGGRAFAPMVGRGCAYLDYDGDGRLDVVVTENNGPARLYRNESPDTNTYARFVLTGADGTNRAAIGAEVTVEAGGRTQRRYVTGSRGYLSQSDCAAFFGLGSATKVDRVTVRWPGRATQVQEWRELPAGTTHYLVEGEADVKRKLPDLPP